jgi:hypothetical protein
LRRGFANDLRVGCLADGQYDFRRIEIGQPPAQPRFGLGRVRWRNVAGVQTLFGSRLDFAQDRNIGALRLDKGLIGEHVHVSRRSIQQHTLANIAQSFPSGLDLQFRNANAVRGLEAIEQDLGHRHADRPRTQRCALHRVVGQQVANRLQPRA